MRRRVELKGVLDLIEFLAKDVEVMTTHFGPRSMATLAMHFGGFSVFLLLLVHTISRRHGPRFEFKPFTSTVELELQVQLPSKMDSSRTGGSRSTNEKHNSLRPSHQGR